ncbi:MAG: ArsC/Spx/MgsR family protein [Thiomicrospira sp.]
MINIEILYNPNCSKSRQTLADLQQYKEFNIKIIDYKQAPPDATRLAQIVEMLGVEIKALIRTEDSHFPSEMDCTLNNQQACLSWLAQHIDYLQRPIVILNDQHAIIARPPADLHEFIRSVTHQHQPHS